MNYLRQSTASQEVLLGPFVSNVDGDTVASGLTIANTDIKIWKYGATTLANKNSGGATHISNGLYYTVLDATDTNTIGPMRLDVHVNNALAVTSEATVLDETVYDVMFGTVAPSTLAAGALMGLASSAITSGVFAPNSITANAVATDVPVKIFDTNISSITTSGTAGGQINDIDTEVDLIYAAVQGIGTSGGAAISKDVDADNSAGNLSAVTTVSGLKDTGLVGIVTGTFSNTMAVDSVYQSVAPSGNNLSIAYQLKGGGGTSPVGIYWTGYVGTSSSRVVTVYAWNHVAGTWEIIGNIVGANVSTNVAKTFNLYARHMGTSAAELGKVYVKFTATAGTAPTLFTDQLYLAYAVTSRSVGYANGAIWLDTVNGISGVELYVNGTADKPVKTWAEALTLATAIGVKTIQVINGSHITLTSDTSFYTFQGDGYEVILNGQVVSETVFVGAWINGTGTGIGFDAHYGVMSSAASLPTGTHLHFMALADTLALQAGGSYTLDQCYNALGGDGESSSPMLDFVLAGEACNVAIRHHSGVIRLQNMVAGDMVSIDGYGGVIIESGCTGGTIVMHGALDLHDNAGGAVTITDTARWNESQNIANVTGSVSGDTKQTADVATLIATVGVAGAGLTVLATASGLNSVVDGVWDELLAEHLDVGSTGAALAAAGGSDDPWAITLPGAYGAGTAGAILASGATASGLAVVDGIVDSIKMDTSSILLDTGTDGVVIPQVQADKVWNSATRTLSAGTNISLAKGTGVTGFNDISSADVNAACDTAIADASLATASSIVSVSGMVAGVEAHASAMDTRLPASPAAVGSSMALTSDSVGDIWDEPLTGATHNVPNSAGRRLRQLASNIILDGLVVSSTDNTVTFDGDASTVDGAYDPSIISIVGGTGAGQSRLVLEYDGDTKTAIVDRNWRVNPNGTSEFIIVSSEGREHVNEGGVQAGGASTVTLNANASDSDNAYVGQVVFIRSGLGEDQARRVIAYNGTTKVATVEHAWDVIPNNTSGYVMLPTSVMPPEYVSDAVFSAIVEGTLSFEEWTRLVSSVLFGKISGAPTGPLLFRDIGDTKDRITATVDEDGNRLDVVTDVT